MIGVNDWEDKVPEIEVAEALVTDKMRLSSLAAVVEVTSKPVRQEKLFTTPVMLTELKPVLVKL